MTRAEVAALRRGYEKLLGTAIRMGARFAPAAEKYEKHIGICDLADAELKRRGRA